MPIVGDLPESGVRIDVERPRAQQGPPWRYEGEACTPRERLPVVVTVTEDGEVEVEVAGASGAALVGGGAALAGAVRLIVRSVWRHARAEKGAPPRRIARWRSDERGSGAQ
jgi:hypothetical protein